jgi:hypothetical protein
MEGKWLSILEYASYKKKSISTVRRYVKANRVKHKEENGKYYIWAKNFVPNHTTVERQHLESKFELERLKKENIELKEEISEAKMLIQLYENGQMLISKKKSDLPELPPSL